MAELTKERTSDTAFAAQLGTESYRSEERGYKWAVRLAFGPLLSAPAVDRPDLDELLAAVFGEPFPDMSAISLSQIDQDFVRQATGSGGLRHAWLA